MKNFMVLTNSVNFIEEHLCDRLSRDEIARECYVSLSSLEKLFRYALHMSIQTYILKRRMTLAAKDITYNSLSITDAAMKYGYNSVEVFSRAFKRVWGIMPSEFRENRSFTGIFPKINYEYRKGDDLIMARKRVDLSEAYEYIRSKENSYVLCFDGVHFMAINEISRQAGDLALVEVGERIQRYAGDDMLVLRIGGDEFAMLTGLYDRAEAEKLAKRVLAENGKTFDFEGKKIPISLRVGITTVPEHLRYSKLFTDMHEAIEESRISEQ